MGKTKQNHIRINNFSSKRIGLYNPYANLMGGGERYMAQIASLLSTTHEVDFYADSVLVSRYWNKFHLELDKVNFKHPEVIQQNFLRKYLYLRNYDVFFYMTDGSIFFPGAKKNFLVIQSPAHIPKLSIINTIKLNNWQILCYSNYMKNIISKYLPQKIIVLPPCININSDLNDQKYKQNIILTVGRFFKTLHNKRQDLLVQTFIKYYHRNFPDWKFIIAGGLTDKEGIAMINNIKKIAKGHPVDVKTDISFDELSDLYKQAKIYWHATGYGINSSLYPEKVEHFGITSLEAMSAGCVPVSYSAGGQKDIIVHSVNGFLWENTDELISYTVSLIQNNQLFQKISTNCRQRAADFSCKLYDQTLNALIGN